MYELFGFRAWHDGDLSAIDVDVLGLLVASAIQYERDQAKGAKP